MLYICTLGCPEKIFLRFPLCIHQKICNCLSTASIWFLIKQKSSSEEGDKHIFHLIMYSNFLHENITSVVESVIEGNAFFAHPENLLVSLQLDDRDHFRELALQRIIKARNTEYLNYRK